MRIQKWFQADLQQLTYEATELRIFMSKNKRIVHFPFQDKIFWEIFLHLTKTEGLEGWGWETGSTDFFFITQNLIKL